MTAEPAGGPLAPSAASAPGTAPRSGLLGILRDRRLWRGPWPWVLFWLVLANVWVWKNDPDMLSNRRANLSGMTGAGAAVTSGRRRLFPDRGTTPPRFDESGGEATWTFWSDIPDAQKTNLVVLTGMSQNLTINDYSPGQLTIAEQVDELVQGRGARAFGLFAPNLSNEELALLVLSTLSSPQTRPRVLIFGACFDKFRNVDLRPGYKEFLRRTPHLEEAWKQVIAKEKGRYPLATSKMQASLQSLDEDRKKKDDTSAEGRLRDWTGRWVPMVAARSELNVQAQTTAYLARNALLGIKNTSKRPMLASRYELNRELMAMALQQAKAAGVRVGIYVVPLNPTAENPYIPAEYARFKSWLEKFSADNDVTFANFENVVPHEHWGVWMGGPDFKHFRVAGHRLTSQAIVGAFEKLWLSDAGRAQP